MQKLKLCLIPAFLMILSGCSTVSKPSPVPFQGVPASLLDKCKLQGFIQETVTVGDIVENLLTYKLSFEQCAARLEAIRDWDQGMRSL